MLGNNYLLWEDATFIICTPFNPHLSYGEGPILIVKTKHDVENAWQNPQLAGQAFELAAKACKIMENLKLAPWFNIQANGNWGLLPGAYQYFHVYVYGRNKTDRWAKPIILPEAPKTYQNDPMPEADREALTDAFKTLLK
jgi:hypothetical protein